MQNGTSQSDPRDVADALSAVVPLISYALDPTGLTASPEQMVAALYGDYDRLQRKGIETDQSVLSNVAVIMGMDGVAAIERRAARILEEEQAGTLAAPDWLAYCRHRVADVYARQWQACKFRCSCGFGDDELAALEEHLDVTADEQPEHFEVLDGFTLDRVLVWLSGRSTAPAPGRAPDHEPSSPPSGTPPTAPSSGQRRSPD